MPNDCRLSTKSSDLPRRRVLALLASSSALGLLGGPAAAAARPLSIPGVQLSPEPDKVPFSEPPVIASGGGGLSASLDVQLRRETVDGTPVSYRTYNGLFTGPTLRFRPGDVLDVSLANSLPPDEHAHVEDMNQPHGLNTTNLHTHGLWISPQSPSDNVLLSIAPGDGFDYTFEVPQEHVCGTFWYHPHKHGSVEAQVAQGMAGTLIIEGGIDELPGIKGAIERVMVIQQPKPGDDAPRVFSSLGEIAGAPNKTTTINALHAPTITTRALTTERWRLVAANYHDFLHIQLRDMKSGERHPLHPIAYDGIPVRKVESADTVHLAPGNRVDLLVQFPRPGLYEIYKVGDGGQFDADASDETIGFVVVGAPMPDSGMMVLPEEIDVKYSHPDIARDEVTKDREIVYSMEPPEDGGLPKFLINGKEFDENRVDVSMKLDHTEEWVIRNTSDFMHPFHIHVNPFQIVETSDGSIPPGRWLDTVPLSPHGHVRMRMRVQRFTGKFVQHCHILLHEDHGMMQLIEITE